MGRCDEVEELIQNVVKPTFDPELSINQPDAPCPVCHAVPNGQFRAATKKELEKIGLPSSRFKKYRH